MCLKLIFVISFNVATYLANVVSDCSKVSFNRSDCINCSSDRDKRQGKPLYISMLLAIIHVKHVSHRCPPALDIPCVRIAVFLAYMTYTLTPVNVTGRRRAMYRVAVYTH
jgi:hypothetical protein